MSWVAGVDGCRAGWFVVLKHLPSGGVRARVAPTFADVVALPEAPAAVVVDMVIGLLDVAVPGGRACDQAARRLLGRPRASSVFSPPVRPAFGHAGYREALAAQRATAPDAPGFSIEAFHLMPKIREVDAIMTPALQARIVEGHPELGFYALADGTAVAAGKRTPEGRTRRTALLAAAGFDGADETAASFSSSRIGADDVLDAYVLCWTAERYAHRRARRLPPHPPTDYRGLRMEIWF